MSVASTRLEHAMQTREALLSAARHAFAEHGFAAASIDAICAEAHVTKGALYHHFDDKRDLFRAVYAELEQGTVRETLAVVERIDDAWERCVVGCAALLDHCMNPVRQRILLLEGPAVLGAAELRAIDMQQGLDLLAGMLAEAMDAGVLERQDAVALAHLLIGALREAGLAIALAEDQELARRTMGLALTRLMAGLR